MRRYVQKGRFFVRIRRDLDLEGLALLQDLHRLKPEERSVKEALADALESEGEYRQAALLYRDLLRP